MKDPLRLARIGGIAYVLWGIMHIVVGVLPVAGYWGSGPAGLVDALGIDTGPEALTGHVANLLAEHYAELIAFGILAIWVAATLNWRNRPLGFWINLVVLGVVDAAFLLGEVVPGYAPLASISGPVLYVLGAVFTGLGLLGARTQRTGSLHAATAPGG